MGRITKHDVVNFLIRAVFNFLSELVATGTLIFLGCLSTVRGLGQPEDPTGIALSFGFAFLTAIEIGIHVSGGHVNPILSITAVVFKKISFPMYFVYFTGQICGSLLGYGLLVALTPSSLTNILQKNGACVTKPNPNLTVVQALFIEFAASSILVLVFCSQLNPKNPSVDTISLRMGMVMYVCVYSTVHYTGGSINPVRSLAPALWNDTWDYHWIYWVGPITASIIWSLTYQKLFVEVLQKKEKSEE